MSVKVAKIVDWTELSDVDVKVNGWENSEFFTKKNIKRASITDDTEESIVIKTPVLSVAFGAKVSKYDEKKIDVAITVSESDFYKMMTTTLKNKLIQLTKLHYEKIGYENDEEVIEEFYKSAFNHKEGYSPLFNGKIEENKYKKITFNDILIDENDRPVSNPDFITELARGTKVMLIIEIPHIDFYPTEFRPGFKIMKIKIVERASPYVKTYITSENYNKGNIEITEKENNKNGGSFSRVKYHNGEYSSRVSIQLKNMKLAPFSFENTDDNGKTYHGVSATIDNEENHTFLKSLSDDILSSIVKNSKALLGKKKTEKMVRAVFMDILKYSKDDKELIKKGEEPKYKPRIDISASKYDEKFSFKFVDKDDNELNPEDFGEYKATNPETTYDIKCSIRHLWWKTYTIKFILDEIKVSSSSSSGVFKYKFGNEVDDNEEDDNGGPAEEPDEQEEKDDAPSNSDEESDDDDDDDDDDSD